MEYPNRTYKLGIPELIVVNNETDVYIAENREKLSRCYKCGFSHLSFIKEHRRQLLDILNYGASIELIELIHSHPHFVCSNTDCAHFNEKRISFADPRSKFTFRMMIYIYNRRLTDSAHHIETELNGRVTDTAIDDIVSRLTKQLDRTVPKEWEIPTEMGIHSVRIKGTLAWAVTNIKKETLIDILPDTKPETLRAFAKRFKIKRAQREIKTIWVDLDETLLSSIEDVFPNAEIIIGKHQIKRFLTNLLLDSLGDKKEKKRPTDSTFVKPNSSLSKPTKKKLDQYLADNPETKRLYDWKEQIESMPLQQSIDILKSIIDNSQWQSHEDFLLHTSLQPFRKYIESSKHKAMTNEHGEDITSSYHEILDAIIDEHLIDTRKCSFIIMRARILYSNPHLCGEILGENAYREYNQEAPLPNDLDQYCFSLCSKYYHPQPTMSYFNFTDEPKQLRTCGQPLVEVAYRLKKLSEMYGVSKRHHTS